MSPEERFKRWLRPGVFAAWSCFLLYLLASRRYEAFLRPEFGFLLAIAHFIAMGFMITAISRSEARKMDASEVLRTLILLVPILYSLFMPNAMLGNQAFKKRFIGPSAEAAGRRSPFIRSSQATETGSGPAAEITAGMARHESPQEQTLLEILFSPQLYDGRKVTVTGMTLRDDQLKPHFGGRDTVVYRFLINCCAADALPLAIGLDSDRKEDFAGDQWVQVNGVFELRQIDGKTVPMVLNPSIKTVEAPEVPYLF